MPYLTWHMQRLNHQKQKFSGRQIKHNETITYYIILKTQIVSRSDSLSHMIERMGKKLYT